MPGVYNVYRQTCTIDIICICIYIHTYNVAFLPWKYWILYVYFRVWEETRLDTWIDFISPILEEGSFRLTFFKRSLQVARDGGMTNVLVINGTDYGHVSYI